MTSTAAHEAAVHCRRAAALIVHHNRGDLAGINAVLAEARDDDNPGAANSHLLMAVLAIYSSLLPELRTPAGAYLKVRRGPKWTSIEVDRIPVTDATDDQAATAHRLTMAAARHVAALGKRGWLGLGDGRIIWSVVVATADADVALDALLALEAGDPGPAESLADRYEAAS